jgi:hypothetical protein
MQTGIPVAAAIVAAAAVGTAGMAVVIAISVAVSGESDRFLKRSPFGRTRRAYPIQALRLDLKFFRSPSQRYIIEVFQTFSIKNNEYS